VRLYCPDENDGENRGESEVPGGGGLKPNFYQLPRLWSPWASSPFKKNAHGRAGNRTRDLMVNS